MLIFIISLQQEDIGHHYLLCDTLSFVGVELTASWQATRKINNDELVTKVQNYIQSWKSGECMPLVSRPFSINTYCLSKVCFRTGSIDLRVGDIKAITSKVKSYIHQDMYQKPSEVLIFRYVEQGGLGLRHLESKALAHLIPASSKQLQVPSSRHLSSTHCSIVIMWKVRHTSLIQDILLTTMRTSSRPSSM